jgi:hypothetical protein
MHPLYIEKVEVLPTPFLLLPLRQILQLLQNANCAKMVLLFSCGNPSTFTGSLLCTKIQLSD